jgi:hypothetical protein
MPYVSRKQEAYFNANRDKLTKEGVNVDEWNQASKGLKLPKYAHKSTKKIQRAIRKGMRS